MNYNKHSIFLVCTLLFALLSFGLLPYVGIKSLYYTLAVYFFTTCIGGSITYHRLLSHRSFNAPRWFWIMGTCIGVWGLYGSPLAWCAIHRQHHMFPDTQKDPHSPLFKNWWKVQFFSSLYPANLRLVPDLLADPLIVFIHRNYFKIHLFIVLLLITLHPPALLYCYLWPAFFTWNIASLTNSLGHTFGYRNFNTKDRSMNFWPLSILVFGEGWHNNHHAYPKKYSFTHQWWELDISGTIIKYLLHHPPIRK